MSAVAKAAGVLHVCDSTFATPVMTKPIELGADMTLQVRRAAGHARAQRQSGKDRQTDRQIAPGPSILFPFLSHFLSLLGRPCVRFFFVCFICGE